MTVADRTHQQRLLTHLNIIVFVALVIVVFLPVVAQAQFLTRPAAVQPLKVQDRVEPDERRVEAVANPVRLTRPQLRPPRPKKPQKTQVTKILPTPGSGFLTRPAVAPPEKRDETSRPAAPTGEKAPVDFQADSLSHDEINNIVTAQGNVELEQNGRKVYADEIQYHLTTDTVIAQGGVELHEINGDVHIADSVELTNAMKDGFVQGLQSYLIDGSRFLAEEGERQDGTTTIMHDATYTPCEPCKDDPGAAPVWQIRASRVKHHKEERRISYNSAWFEFYGVPLAYTPYFSHPDGTIKRKSGFLSPSAGYKSELGTFVETSYYWDIAPDKDATIGLLAMTEEDPLGFAQYRQRWENAALVLDGSITNSSRTERRGLQDIDIDEETRGHLFADGQWHINNKWRAGLGLELTSDDQYLNQYDFSGKDILENEAYLERFSGRHYAVGRLLAFRDVRVEQDQVDQPNILPEIVTSFVGEPGSMPVVGGRWSVDASYLGLNRNGDDQDMNRLSAETAWQKRFVSNIGLVTTIDASARADLYNVRDRAIATAGSGRSRESTASEFFPGAHIQSSFPVAKNFKTSQLTIEPIAAVTLAPNVDVSNDIPNEDSQDVQIDASNLFEANRFPGLDRIEDKSHATYGLRTGLYGDRGSFGELFLGQSRRFDDDDNPFPEGSGLNDQESDYVGQLSFEYDDRFSGNYRFQLNQDNFASERHEAGTYLDLNRFTLSTRYLFAKALEGTNIDESREQFEADATYYLSKDWRVHFGGTQDLGEDEGLRESYFGIDYFGQCISWSVTGERNLTDDSSGESDTEIVFRIGLRNLGEFMSSGLRGSN